MKPRKTYLTEFIGVRLAPETVAILDERAESQRLALSAYIRKIIEREASRDLQPTAAGDGDDD